ncbi:MAG: hypothetical protein WCG25_01760 [bacterium]
MPLHKFSAFFFTTFISLEKFTFNALNISVFLSKFHSIVFFSTVFTENDNHIVHCIHAFISVFIAFHAVVSMLIHHLAIKPPPEYLNKLLIHDPWFNSDMVSL